MPPFVSGLDLSQAFFEEAVGPLLEDRFPRLRYGAALIGDGSEVLGFDTEMSGDHSWGPRVLLFLPEEDIERTRTDVEDALRQSLPREFRGYPPADDASGESPNGYRVSVETVRSFVLAYLGFDLAREPEPEDWLTFPEQKLRALTSGRVFRNSHELHEVREAFAYYPPDVWRYQLAAAWNRIGQEEHLMGRAGSVGDEIGSSLIAARLVRDLMRLGFLMERQYAPYPKWFGTAFARLSCAPRLTPVLQRILTTPTWPERDEHLAQAYGIVAEMHNALALTAPIPARVAPFYTRPFRVIHLHGDFAEKIAATIEDPRLRHLAESPLIGGIDLLSDNTDLLSRSRYRQPLRQLYEA